MKISIKQVVMLFLGLFLLKIAVADPFRDEQIQKDKRRPASVSIKRVSSSY